MTRHSLVLQSSYVNKIHGAMNELIRSPDTVPTIDSVQMVFNRLHLDSWLDDPLVRREPSILNRELVLHSVLSTVCTYIESAVERNDKHVVSFAVILLFLFYRPGLQYRIKTDRLEWLKQVALGNDKYPYCHDCFLYLLEQGAFVAVVWSRHADVDDLNIEVVLGRKRQLSNSQRQRRRELKGTLDGLLLRANERPKGIDELLPALSHSLSAYNRSKEALLSQSALASRSKAWKSGLHLIRPKLCDNIAKLLEDMLPMTHPTTHPTIHPTTHPTTHPNPQSQAEQTKPKRTRGAPTTASSSSSSSSSRPSTPFQEVSDMPKIV